MKLNLGSGTGPSANHFFTLGYENIDRQTGGEIYPLVFADECAEEIRASHCLEHLPFCEIVNALREWVRVLKPGGILKIAVPDFEWICRRYLAMIDENADHVNVTGFLMGGQTDNNDYHKAIFDRIGLTEGMKAAGLVDIRGWKSEIDDCASLPVSLNLQGTKPGYRPIHWRDTANHEEIAEADRIASVVKEHADSLQTDELPADTILFKPEMIGCVMSVPRLGFTSNMQCLLTIANLGIQVRQQLGAFWGQCLTEGISAFLEDDKKYILTVDYDTIFSAEDVLTLYQYMESPGGATIDALTTVQVRRENDNVLLTMADAEGKPRSQVLRDELAQDVVKVRSAHFGLTLFRASSFAKLSHPWFLDEPDPEGKWGKGKVDCDVAFWRKWADAGNSLYLANRIAVGHLELAISWPSDTLGCVSQRISDYQRDGKSKAAWK